MKRSSGLSVNVIGVAFFVFNLLACSSSDITTKVTRVATSSESQGEASSVEDTSITYSYGMGRANCVLGNDMTSPVSYSLGWSNRHDSHLKYMVKDSSQTDEFSLSFWAKSDPMSGTKVLFSSTDDALINSRMFYLYIDYDEVTKSSVIGYHFVQSDVQTAGASISKNLNTKVGPGVEIPDGIGNGENQSRIISLQVAYESQDLETLIGFNGFENWHHYNLTIDMNTPWLTVYVDGVDVAVTPSPVPLGQNYDLGFERVDSLANNHTYNIGLASAGSAGFVGQIASLSLATADVFAPDTVTSNSTGTLLDLGYVSSIDFGINGGYLSFSNELRLGLEASSMNNWAIFPVDISGQAVGFTVYDYINADPCPAP